MTNSTKPRSIVFYADDDLDDLELVKDAFAQYSKDIEVLTAADGSKALSYLSNLKEYDALPCLIILELFLLLKLQVPYLLHLSYCQFFALLFFLEA